MHKYFLILIQFILISFKAHTVEAKLDDLPVEISAYITKFLSIADCAAFRQTNKFNSQILTGQALKKRFLNAKITEINKAKELIYQYTKLYDLTITSTGFIYGNGKANKIYNENSSQIRYTLRNILDSTIATGYLLRTCECFSSAYKAHTIDRQLPPKKAWDTPKGKRQGNYKQKFDHDSASWLNSFGCAIAKYYYG